MYSFRDYQFKLIQLEELKVKPNFKKRKYNDAIYYGQTREGFEREGLGVMVYFSGRMYEGNWKKDMRTGQGREVFNNGNLYEGNYLLNRPHGRGDYFW